MSVRRLVLGVLALGSVFAVILIIHHWLRHPPPPHPKIDIAFDINPPGARLRIDGQNRGLSPLTIPLPKGTYKLEATKEGYAPLSTSVNVQPGMAAKLPFTLKPLPLKLQLVATDFKNPEILWDGTPAGNVTGGKWDLDVEASPQPHSLEISDGGIKKTTLSFSALAGTLPVMTAPPEAKNVSVVSVSTFGSQGHLIFTPEEISVDGQSYNSTPEGVDVSHFPIGPHTITWVDHGSSMTENFESGPAPALTIFLSAVTSTVVKPQKPKAPPTQPSQPPTVVGPDTTEIARLEKLAGEATGRGDYLEPAGSSCIDYGKRLVVLEKSSTYPTDILNYCVQRVKVLAEAALNNGDDKTASRMAGALVKLLPDNETALNLQKEVGEHHPPRPPQAPPLPPKLSRKANRLVDKSTYPGMLIVVNQHLQFKAESVPDEKSANVDVSCGDINEVKNRHKNKFRVSTNSGGVYDFESTSTNIDEVESACKK